jgi:hypothetical protein
MGGGWATSLRHVGMKLLELVPHEASMEDTKYMNVNLSHSKVCFFLHLP